MKVLKRGQSINWSKLGLKINREYVCELCGCVFSLNKKDLVKITTCWKELEKKEEFVNGGAGILMLYSVQMLFANLLCPICGHTNELKLKLWRKFELQRIDL